MPKQKYDVTGMTCSACSAHVEKAVRKVAGVQDVTVNLLTNSMVVEADASLSPQAITAAVEKAGYGASPAGAGLGCAGCVGAEKDKPRCAANGGYEKTPYRFICFSGAADVRFHGQHGGPAAARLSYRH